MFNFMHALKRITLTVLLSVIVGLVSFEIVKSMGKGYFSLIDKVHPFVKTIFFQS